MAEAVTREIDGHEYTIKPFMGMTGWRMQLALGKMIGPALKEAIGALPKGKIADMLKADIDPAAIGVGIATLIDAIAAHDPKGDFVAQLLSQTERDGRLLTQSAINEVYAANYLEMSKAVFAVVTANGFFGLSGTGMGALTDLVSQGRPETLTKA